MGNNSSGASSSACKTDCQLCWQLKNDCDACFNSPTDTGCDPAKAPDNCESCWRWKQSCYDCFDGGCCSQKSSVSSILPKEGISPGKTPNEGISSSIEEKISSGNNTFGSFHTVNFLILIFALFLAYTTFIQKNFLKSFFLFFFLGKD